MLPGAHHGNDRRIGAFKLRPPIDKGRRRADGATQYEAGLACPQRHKARFVDHSTLIPCVCAGIKL